MISVIIPVYNTGDKLRICLNSLLHQTYLDFEIIAVNDGSTDKSLDILHCYQPLFKNRLKIINQNNNGVSQARKVGFANSQGEFIACIDSDDNISPNYLESLYNSLIRNESNIAFSRIINKVDSPFIDLFSLASKKRKEIVLFQDEKEYLVLFSSVFWAKLYRRKFLEFSEKDLRSNEDMVINYVNYALANRVSFVNDAFYSHIQNSSGLSAVHGLNYQAFSMLNNVEAIELLRENFIKYELYSKFETEIETLFIKLFFEKVFYVFFAIKNKEFRKKLIQILISIMENYFPNWRENTHFKNDLNLFDFLDKMVYKTTRAVLNHIEYLGVPFNRDTLFEMYKEAADDYGNVMKRIN